MDDANMVDGVMWFRSVGDLGRENKGGLSLAITERMKWQAKRVEEFGICGLKEEVWVSCVGGEVLC